VVSTEHLDTNLAACANKWEDEQLGDIFFPEAWKEGTAYAVAKAKLLCAKCPIAVDCFDAAMAEKQIGGVWGGTTEGERTLMRRNLRLRVEHKAILLKQAK
jgi:WhiB family redox-sensing transcriptional regulator